MHVSHDSGEVSRTVCKVKVDMAHLDCLYHSLKEAYSVRPKCFPLRVGYLACTNSFREKRHMYTRVAFAEIRKHKIAPEVDTHRIALLTMNRDGCSHASMGTRNECDDAICGVRQQATLNSV